MLKPRHTLILLVICAAVVLYFYLVEKPARQTSRQEQEKAKRVFSFEPEEVERVTIFRDGEKITFVKRESPEKKEDWFIGEGANVDADDYLIDGIVSRFSRLSIEKVVSSSLENLEAFGLKPPRYRVEFYVKGSTEPYVLMLGNRSPVGFKLYAMKMGDNRVFLVTAGIETNLKKKLDDYRNKKVTDFLVSEVTDLYIKKKGEIKGIRIIKVEGDWYIKHLVDRESVRADKSVVNRVLTALRDLRAKKFINDNPSEADLKKYGLLDPNFKVTIVLEDGKKQVLLIGKRTKDKKLVYVKRESLPNVVAVDAEILAKIDKKPYQWRIKKIFDFYTWKAERLYISDKYGTTYAIKNKEDNNWYDETGKDKKPKDAINEILRLLRDITVIDYIAVDPDSLSPYGLDRPKIHVRVKVEGELEERGIFFGDEVTDGIYAMLEGDDEVYLVKKDFLDKFEKARVKILNPEELNPPAGEEKKGKKDTQDEGAGKK